MQRQQLTIPRLTEERGEGERETEHANNEHDILHFFHLPCILMPREILLLLRFPSFYWFFTILLMIRQKGENKGKRGERRSPCPHDPVTHAGQEWHGIWFPLQCLELHFPSLLYNPPTLFLMWWDFTSFPSYYEVIPYFLCGKNLPQKCPGQNNPNSSHVPHFLPFHSAVILHPFLSRLLNTTYSVQWFHLLPDSWTISKRPLTSCKIGGISEDDSQRERENHESNLSYRFVILIQHCKHWNAHMMERKNGKGGKFMKNQALLFTQNGCMMHALASFAMTLCMKRSIICALSFLSHWKVCVWERWREEEDEFGTGILFCIL